jgi:hypothetical protein
VQQAFLHRLRRPHQHPSHTTSWLGRAPGRVLPDAHATADDATCPHGPRAPRAPRDAQPSTGDAAHWGPQPLCIARTHSPPPYPHPHHRDRQDLYDAFYLGFGTGFSALVLLGMGGTWLYRRTIVSPGRVIARALAVAQKSRRVAGAIGGSVKQGRCEQQPTLPPPPPTTPPSPRPEARSLKAYVHHPGHYSVAKRLAWVEPRAQVLFNIAGERGEAVVSAEGVKVGGSVILTSVAVDASPAGGDAPVLFLLKGDESKLHAAGHVRGFLQLQRARYVPQDTADDDDARLKEQEAAAAAASASGGAGSGGGQSDDDEGDPEAQAQAAAAASAATSGKA